MNGWNFSKSLPLTENHTKKFEAAIGKSERENEFWEQRKVWRVWDDVSKTNLPSASFILGSCCCALQIISPDEYRVGRSFSRAVCYTGWTLDSGFFLWSESPLWSCLVLCPVSPRNFHQRITYCISKEHCYCCNSSPAPFINMFVFFCLTEAARNR